MRSSLQYLSDTAQIRIKELLPHGTTLADGDLSQLRNRIIHETNPSSAAPKELRWTAAGATDISGKEPFSRRDGVNRTGDCPWAGRRNC